MHLPLARLRRALLLVATGAILIAAGGAQGAFYNSRFDPYGSGTFPGFSGEANFEVDAACLNSGNGYFVTSIFPACHAEMLSATVSLFSPLYAGDLLNTANRVDSLSFGPASVLGLLVINGKVEGIDLGFISPIGPANGHGVSSSPDHPWNSSTQFFLQYQSGCLISFPSVISCLPAHVGALPPIGSEPAGGYDPNPAVFLYEKGPTGRLIQSVAATDVTFQVVPEPGTVTLVAAALALCWFGSRRRARA